MLSSEKVGLGKCDVQTLTNENKTSYMLVIRNISEVDAGEYYCSLTPEGQTSYICDQKTGILYVNVEAQRPDIVDEILPEVKQKNQIGYLNCTVVNKGNESVVQWSKVETLNGGNPILLSEDDKTVYREINRTGLYQYSNKKSHNNGKEICSIVFVYIEGQAGTYLIFYGQRGTAIKPIPAEPKEYYPPTGVTSPGHWRDSTPTGDCGGNSPLGAHQSDCHNPRKKSSSDSGPNSYLPPLV
uniref:Ig-like domain-containing protein n=1 Tax=Magallana gigas TaxID=29159 RepID=A0A8W8L8G8_MAGGI